MALTAGMTHLEMDAFEDPDPTTFDPVVWLNEAALGQGFRGAVREGGAGDWEEEVRSCADADKFFTELSLKLQILGQEAEVGAEEAVVDGLKRMPRHPGRWKGRERTPLSYALVLRSVHGSLGS